MHRKHYGLKIIVILEIAMILENSCLIFTSPDTEMSCLFMQSCILPCSLKNGDDFAISWFYTEGNLNIHYYHNQDQLGHQNQRFRNRTSLFKDQFPRNNFSLKLTGVEIQDEGRYQCYVSSGIRGDQELFINLKVDAPVSDIRIHQDGNRITCSSEGIYPQPELTWSTEPPSNTALQNRTTVHQTEEKLYDISSSLTGPDEDSNVIYSCSIRTRRNQRRATLRRLSVTSAPYRTTTLHCSDSNSSAASLVWRFNDQIILSQTEPSVSPRVSEAWRKHVKVESRSGSLTLQDMTSQQEGVYTCELSSQNQTIITKTSVRINQESRAVDIGIIIGVVVVVVFIIAAIILWKKCRKNAGEAQADQGIELQTPEGSHAAE